MNVYMSIQCERMFKASVLITKTVFKGKAHTKFEKVIIIILKKK